MKIAKKLVAVPVRSETTPDVRLVAELAADDVEELVGAGVDVQSIEREPDTGKKGFAFVVPLLAMIPETAVIIGAATLGLVGGATSVIGGRIINWAWPSKRDKFENHGSD